MNETSFVLTEQPWLPCETIDGARTELSLRDVLVRAHELRALSDASPLVTAALHRLLLAVLQRCVGPDDVATWLALHAAGRFAPEAIDAYLGAWKHRFDLFHPERPFYQVRGLPDADDDLSLVVTEQSRWGSARAVFEHRPEDFDGSMEPAAAARALVAFQAYALGGLVKKPGEPTSASGGPLVGGLVVMVEGETLFETLLLNLLIVSGDEPVPASNDAPAWEQPPLPQQLGPGEEPRRMPRGWLDLLTWQSRRAELKVHGGRVVGWIRRVGQGLLAGSPLDPMMAWQEHDKFGVMPLKLNPDRAFWRGSHTLLVLHDERVRKRPRALDQLAKPAISAQLDTARPYTVGAYGLASDQAKVLMARSESLVIPAKLLDDAALGEAVRELLGVLEQVGSSVRGSAFLLAKHSVAPGPRDPDTKDVQNVAESLGAGRHYWSRLQTPFQAFLLAVTRDLDAAGAELTEVATALAREAIERAVRSSGTTARALKAGSIARSHLERELRKAIPERYRRDGMEKSV